LHWQHVGPQPVLEPLSGCKLLLSETWLFKVVWIESAPSRDFWHMLELTLNGPRDYESRHDMFFFAEMLILRPSLLTGNAETTIMVVCTG
jgi:hypothetical protein